MTRDFRFRLQFRLRLTDSGQFVVPVLGLRKDTNSPFSLFVLCYLFILAKKINRVPTRRGVRGNNKEEENALINRLYIY